MSSTVLLRCSARCIQRAFMPYCLEESRKRLIPSSIQPLATWTERLKRWSSGNQTEKVGGWSVGDIVLKVAGQPSY